MFRALCDCEGCQLQNAFEVMPKQLACWVISSIHFHYLRFW